MLISFMFIKKECNQEVLDVLLSKCKLIRQDAASQRNESNCTIH